MRIRSFSANNYKSILQLDKFELTDGFNIITGGNAAGKTALLELLSLHFLLKPHRSIKTVPNKGDITDPTSVAHVGLQLKNSELKRILRNSKETVWVPYPDPKSPMALDINATDFTGPSLERFIRWFTSQPNYLFDLDFMSSSGIRPSGGLHSFVNYPVAPNVHQQFYYSGFSVNLSNEIDLCGGQWQVNRQDLGVSIAPQLQQLIYRFSSERRIQAKYSHGTRSQLSPNAENLAEVLHVLQPDANAFAEFNRQVSEILPQVQWVSVRPVPEGNEVAIWNGNSKREDLAVSLDETGSGVGQVLAILYVVFTSTEPSTIIIDEPQSFLHPASAVKLIQVLKRYPQHQFILATHSPSIITAAGPSNLLALTYDGETHMEVFDLQKATSFQAFLNTAGLEIRDTFGAENYRATLQGTVNGNKRGPCQRHG
jgi:predicted ATPase